MKDVKWLVAVRHCLDLSDDDLTEGGIRQAKLLARQLRETLPENLKVLILTSPPGRARETALIIARGFKTDIEVCDELELDHHCHGERQMIAIERLVNGHAVIIAVTHFEAPSGIMNAVCQKYFQTSYPPIQTNKGTGLILDFSTGEVVSVP